MEKRENGQNSGYESDSSYGEEVINDADGHKRNEELTTAENDQKSAKKSKFIKLSDFDDDKTTTKRIDDENTKMKATEVDVKESGQKQESVVQMVMLFV